MYDTEQDVLVGDESTTEPLFIVEIAGDPSGMTAAQMERFLASMAADLAHGHGNHEDVRIWLWAGDGTARELAVQAAPRSEFDGNDYADQTWSLIDPDGDGRTLVSVAVRIDGRA